MSTPAPIRVVIAKPGLDGHDRGAKVVARALRDAGIEVVYTGLHQLPEQIVATAIQEDADGVADIKVFVGGIVPEEDIRLLADAGVAAVFTPGTPTQTIVDWVKANLGKTAATA